jgi:hypothetical protein
MEIKKLAMRSSVKGFMFAQDFQLGSTELILPQANGNKKASDAKQR